MRFPVRRKLPALLTVVALLLTAACGGGSDGASATKAKSSSGTISDVNITGEFGTTPTVKVSPPLKISKSSTEVLTKGTGPTLSDGDQALVHLSLRNGTTGKAIGSTYDQGVPTPITLNAAQMPAALAKALQGNSQGSRVAVAAPASELYGSKGNPSLSLKPTDSLVIVVDIVAVQASDVLSGPKGSSKAPAADLPKIVKKDGKVSALDFTNTAKKQSQKLQVVTLVKGTGPKTTKQSLVTLDFLGQVYGKSKPFNNTFASGGPSPFPLGFGGVIPAWDKALVGVPIGSRVMLIAPPALAYGAQGSGDGEIPKNATLVFLIDVLGASA